MAKTAFLVDFSIRTRVVVDIPDGEDVNNLSDATHEAICSTAAKRIVEQIENFPDGHPICGENVTEIMEDTEMPYSPDFDDAFLSIH